MTEDYDDLITELKRRWLFGDQLSVEAGNTIIDLLAKNARLEEALEPFAAIPEVFTCEVSAAHYWCVIGSPGKTHFTREDLARARAALNGEPG